MEYKNLIHQHFTQTQDIYQNLGLFPVGELLKKTLPLNPRLLLFGNFGAYNLGDEAILSGELAELALLPKSKLTIVSRFPGQIKAVYKKNAISLFNSVKIVFALLRTDAVIFGGGGILARNDNGIISFLYQLYSVTMFLVLPTLLRKKLYVIGIGVYANANSVVMKIAKSALAHAMCVTVRDIHSYHLLSTAGIPVKVFKDMSFLLPLLSRDAIYSHPAFLTQYDPERFHVGISVKQPDSLTEEAMLTQVLLSFIKANAANTDFWFYALDTHPGYNNDLKFITKLSTIITNTIAEPVRVHIISPKLSTQEVFSSFQLMDFFIAMRLHASIFAYRCNTPFVGISYDVKCTSFIQSIGKHCFTAQSITAAQLQDEFSQVQKLAKVN